MSVSVIPFILGIHGFVIHDMVEFRLDFFKSHLMLIRILLMHSLKTVPINIECCLVLIDVFRMIDIEAPIIMLGRVNSLFSGTGIVPGQC